MQHGMIGLGRMGAGLVPRLTKDGHKCIVYDVSPAAVKRIAGLGIRGSVSARVVVRISPIGYCPRCASITGAE